MQKRFKLFTPIIVTLMSLCALLVLFTYFTRPQTLFFAAAALTLMVFLIVLILLRRASKGSGVILQDIEQGIRYTLSHDYANFPMPVVTICGAGEIVWYNEMCGHSVFNDRDMRGEEITEVFEGLDVAVLSAAGLAEVACGSRLYTVYASTRLQGEETVLVLYLIENTQLKYYAEEYHLSKLSVILMVVDNYDEMTQDIKETDRARIMGDIQRVVEEHFAAHNGFTTKISRDKFLAFVEERGLVRMLGNKFDILDRVRAIQTGETMSATLSIGIGRGAGNLYEAEAMARQAMDMCLGRGGDQVAVKTQNGYEFYGGVSKAIEKRTKVKTRIIASALSELIESSSNVLVMGHRFADLDCLGAAVGILKTVRQMGKPGAIAIDAEKNLVRPLLEKLLLNGYTPGDFMRPEEARAHIGEHTLLVVVDTHVPQVLESEELYRACKTVVVIDHHRKLVEHIDNAVIFYHEPYASSASEMVAELVQYFPARPHINRAEAEAMMAGIMLDTKNFVMRTGVRTFEAAAYLRRMGADTVDVRKLFSSSMDAYQKKISLVSTADVYRCCAIAESDTPFEDIRVVAPQAADELMTINGVDASFILYMVGDVVHVSARSMGAFNVQVIMERLGGGGHQAMAAAQFPGESVENVRRRLMEAIDEFCDARDSRLQKAELIQAESNIQSN